MQETAQIDLDSEEIIFCDDPTSDDSGDNCDKEESKAEKRLSFWRNRQLSLPKMNFGAKNGTLKNSKTSPNFHEELKEDEDLEQRSRWNTFLERALTTSPLDSRAFRAGVILNPLRGLTMEENATVQDDKITTTASAATEGGNFFLLGSIKERVG